MSPQTLLSDKSTARIIYFLMSFSLVSSPLRGESQSLTTRSSMSWYTFGTLTQPVNDSPLNPDNTTLQLDTQSAAFDIRPDLRVQGGSFKLIARPQLKTVMRKSKIKGADSTEHPKSTGRWIEAYGVLTASDKVLVSYGLQNYQWGAAESINPSNRIFHENVDSKGILYTVEGRNISRVNLSWTKKINSVLMSETEKAKDITEFRSEETFQTKALMKHEMNWNSGADYLGFVYGSGETGGAWLGEYFNLTVADGLTLYGDAAHQKNSDAWYPVKQRSAQAPTQETIQLTQAKVSSGKTYTLAVLGTRYSFEGGSDLRFEFIANSAGWTKEENEVAMDALNTSSPLQVAYFRANLGRILRPGLEYRGQKYALVSLRVPDAFSTKDLTVYARMMRSLTDFSASFYSSLEYGFWSSSTLILSAYMTQGSVESDLRGVVASSIAAGLRQDF